MTEDEILFHQKELDTLVQSWEERFHKARGEREWWCGECKLEHRFKDLIVYQTQHYVRPYSCNGGDYWLINEDELFWQCTDCNTINRMMFHSFRDETTDAHISSCEQFTKRYYDVFKDVKLIAGQYSESNQIVSVNNYFMSKWDNFKYYVPDFENPWECEPKNLIVSSKYKDMLSQRINELYNITTPEPKTIFLSDLVE